MTAKSRLFKTCLAVLAAAITACPGCSAPPAQELPIKRVNTVRGEPHEPKAPEKQAPAVYWVKLQTTEGDILIECHRAWSPYGADRFYELVASGFYDGCRVFRVVRDFVIQTGINGDPKVNAKWRDKSIPDDHFRMGDRNKQSNRRGCVTFAQTDKPNSRTTQFFINKSDNTNLNADFTPFGKVLDGMAAVDSMYPGYGEEPLRSSDKIEAEGTAYLDAAFPKLDTIVKATILPKKPDLPKPQAE